jgi:hypothetical protein
MSKQDARRIAAAEEGSVYSSISYWIQGWKLTRCSHLRHHFRAGLYQKEQSWIALSGLVKSLRRQKGLTVTKCASVRRSRANAIGTNQIPFPR